MIFYIELSLLPLLYGNFITMERQTTFLVHFTMLWPKSMKFKIRCTRMSFVMRPQTTRASPIDLAFPKMIGTTNIHNSSNSVKREGLVSFEERKKSTHIHQQILDTHSGIDRRISIIFKLFIVENINFHNRPSSWNTQLQVRQICQ